MAKGDHDAAMNQINADRSTMNQQYTDTRNKLSPLYDQAHNQFNNQMGQFNNNLSNFNPQYSFAYGGGNRPQMDTSFVDQWNPEAMSHYRDFANTGGYTDQNLADIRARSVSPTRAMYANAKDQMARNLSLAGPSAGLNYNAALGRMTRQESDQIGQQNQATEAGIAQMVNQGKQFGTQGMGGLNQAQLQTQLGARSANLNAAMQMAGIQSQQEIMGNQQNLQKLGLALQATGLSQQESNQILNAMIENQGQQGNYALGSQRNQIGASQIPGDFQQGLGNAGGILGLASQFGGAFKGGGWQSLLGGMGGGKSGNNAPNPYDDNSMAGYSAPTNPNGE